MIHTETNTCTDVQNVQHSDSIAPCAILAASIKAGGRPFNLFASQQRRGRGVGGGGGGSKWLSLLLQRVGINRSEKEVCLFVDCLTSQQHASVSQGRIYSDNCTCCHTETEVAEPSFYQSKYTDTGPISPSTDPITPGAWQGSHWSANF